MILTAWGMIFLAGCGGGLLGEFLTLYEESRNDPSVRVKRKRDGFYWLMSLAMAVAGGVIAVLYGFKEVPVFAVVNIGASAPVLIKSGFASFSSSSKPKIS
jgi:hypothetical protein